MSTILDNFIKAKKQFESERDLEDGPIVMKKIKGIVDDIGSHWNTFTGGDLAERQVKLAGYQFYLADYIPDLSLLSKQYELEIKNVTAARWDDITETIKAQFGKVKNKEQVANVLVIETKELATQEILYEAMHAKYKLKWAALENIITAIVQQIAFKKSEIELSRKTQ